MGAVAKAFRLWNTVRWLKPVQVYGRVWFRFTRPKPDLRPAPEIRRAAGPWVSPARREQSLATPSQMRFLGVERDIDAHGWDDPRLEKLWRYNQHYFDDLCAVGAPQRAEWHRVLIGRWLAECPPGCGTAWEPYPMSLRIVNWIKWLRAGNDPVPGMLDSLAAQARFLSKRLEWHLLGNHLFVNAKALVVAGLYFEGLEADRWRETGWRILRAEIPEQILADGGQFERSPMYHALALEDMLDLLNAMRAAPGATSVADERRVSAPIDAMRGFLAAVCHPDGEVASFNDSAQGIAPTRAELEAYAARLGLDAARLGLDAARLGLDAARLGLDAAGAAPADEPRSGALAPMVRHLAPSGFVRIDSGDVAAILDVGPIGPDYLPGHAHADTLSFELSIAGERVLVNSGTSRYGVGPERLRERGTAAHCTVVVAGADSSEVWGGFRVARRARPGPVSVRVEGDAVAVSASHDGYRRLPGGGDHERSWRLSASGVLVVADRAMPWPEAESHWHFAPGFELAVDPDGRTLHARGPGLRVECSVEPHDGTRGDGTRGDGTRGDGTRGDGTRGDSPSRGAEWRVCRSTYSPRFGVCLPNQKAILRFGGPQSTVRIAWFPCTSSS